MNETPGFHAFPKIFSVGTNYIAYLLDGDVEITEKVDGSQFAFGRRDGVVRMRSKGQEIFKESPNKMFQAAVDRVVLMEEQGNPKITEGYTFYCEYLQKPRHNVLAYERTPKNNLVLFGVQRPDGSFCGVEDRNTAAALLGIDAVPVLHTGKATIDLLKVLLDTDSYLGGQKVEGVVVKNYGRPFLLGGQPIQVMAGKLVRDDFKEVMRTGQWRAENTGKGQWETAVEGYRTEARWQKAVQRLREAGTLTGSPQDIGPLIRSVRQDIVEEERREIEQLMWRCFHDDVLRKSIAGLPEWYKGQLMQAMEEGAAKQFATDTAVLAPSDLLDVGGL
jgi:hypothetical protein